MKKTEISLKAQDGALIASCMWAPDEQSPKAVVIINHGMAEHKDRYDNFASFLCDHGYVVFAKDHRGHGASIGSEGTPGFFANKDGWSLVVEDIHTLFTKVKELYPHIPVLMIGHSMGSFLTRHYLSLYAQDLKGAIISGTGYNPKPLLAIATHIAKSQVKKGKGKEGSEILDKLSFGTFNKPFEKNGEPRTGFEWLSRDKEQVKLYVDDPLCGFLCTPLFFLDLFSGLKTIQNKSFIDKVPQDFPILFYSGDQDPVGNNGKGVKKVYSLYGGEGNKARKLILKPEGRHESLNEVDKESVYKEFLAFLDSCLK